MGSMVSGIYKMGTGAVGVFGGSPQRMALDQALDSQTTAGNIGEVEARQSGDAEAAKLRMLGSQLIARQKTAYSASGVDPTQGTPLSVMADTRLMSELDARMAENNAARKVRGFEMQKTQARQAWNTGVAQDEMNSVGSLLSGFGDMLGGAGGGGGGA